jgi:pectate lyase
MTRGSVFFATVLLVASLGATAQNNEASAPQNSSVNSTQQNVVVQTTAGSQSSTETASPARDLNISAATANRNAELKTVAQNEEPAATPNGQLPQTSTILPLLGLIGLGSLVAGFFARR